MATFTTQFRDSYSPTIPGITNSTRLIDLTVGQLQKIIAKSLEAAKPVESNTTDEYVYGLKGLAQVLGCAKQQAWYIKSTGRYSKAIKQEGRKIIVNKTLLLKMIPHA